jgi:hypothetical protein
MQSNFTLTIAKSKIVNRIGNLSSPNPNQTHKPRNIISKKSTKATLSLKKELTPLVAKNSLRA